MGGNGKKDYEEDSKGNGTAVLCNIEEKAFEKYTGQAHWSRFQEKPFLHCNVTEYPGKALFGNSSNFGNFLTIRQQAQIAFYFCLFLPRLLEKKFQLCEAGSSIDLRFRSKIIFNTSECKLKRMQNPYLTLAQAIKNFQANSLPGAQATTMAAEAEDFTQRPSRGKKDCKKLPHSRPCLKFGKNYKRFVGEELVWAANLI